MKGSGVIIGIVIVCIIVTLGMLVFIFFSTTNKSTTSVSTSTTVLPTVSVKDFAPNLPLSQKTIILIQLSDSSMEKYIVPTDQVSTYIKSLPEGDHVMSTTPN